MAVDNKKIAKNTLILYARMIIMMLVGLYTSRIILQNLGVDDYGIYGIVGGVVGFMGFLNAALATSSSRFLTYALGKGNFEDSKNTFSTTLAIHVFLGVLILIVGEVIGPWMIENKFIIPEERRFAAHVAFQFSLLTTAVGVSQVPYTATLQAHEDFDMVAYTSIADVVLRLVNATLLTYCGTDKLIFFAGFLFFSNVGMMTFYRFYCGRKYEEAILSLHIDKPIFKKIASFSGWSLFQNFIYTLNGSGTTMLMGMFFSPALIASKAISVKVNAMTTQFIGLFRQAMNPQIVKLYASGEIDEYKKLTLRSGLYSFFIMWIMTLPMCMLAHPLLQLWLGQDPPYAAYFCVLIMIDSLFWLFDCSFRQGIIATGDIKFCTILNTIFNVLRFPIIYVVFKFGGDMAWSFYISIIFGAIVGVIAMPYVLIRQCGFKVIDFVNVYKLCLLVVVISSVGPYLIYSNMRKDSLVTFFVVGIISVISAIVSIYCFGLPKEDRVKLKALVINKLKRDSQDEK